MTFRKHLVDKYQKYFKCYEKDYQMKTFDQICKLDVRYYSHLKGGFRFNIPFVAVWKETFYVLHHPDRKVINEYTNWTHNRSFALVVEKVMSKQIDAQSV